ncbi:response regulator [Roseomonas sp. SSH11]|uniref:histidine kinase n=2 Tax=Pararoseomonas baculiformis TaxID=2820812 RepID=A0ABS4AJV3_9PROT|nr:response regulator [Pararoseomonas baculiformis]
MTSWAICSGAAWFTAERYAGRVEEEAKAAAWSRAEVATETIEQSLLRTFEAVEGLHDLAQARQQLLERGDRGGADTIAAQLINIARRGRFGVLQVALIGSEGRVTWSSVADWQAVDLSDREHFRVHREGRRDLFISAPVVGRVSNQWSVQVTRPLRSLAGDFAGVAVVSMDPVELSQQLASLQFGAGSSATVLRRDGIIIARSRDVLQALGQVIPSEAALMQALEASPTGRLSIPRSVFDGRPKLTAYRSPAGLPLVVSVFLDEKQELARTAFVRPALRGAAGGISLLALAVVALLLLWIERQRTRAALELARHEREAALERLAQAQRMEALGRLAGGIAHDFNNVLQAILGGARGMQRRQRDPEAIERLAGMIAEAAERGASVTRRLLAFARRGELRSVAVDIPELLNGLREVLTHTIGPNIQVRIEASPTLPKALTDPGQLETVLVNLAVNARDAMAPRGGGDLVLSAAVEDNRAGPGSLPSLGPGAYLRLDVTDTGMGMDATTLSRAGEPFFTTKPKGNGTGLGLAMAKGFAEQSGGAFGIESEPGHGTTITLWLPCAFEEKAVAASPAPAPVGPAAAGRSSDLSGRILLVDDEPQVRAVLASALRDHGHQVDEAQDGAAALLQLDGCDLLVTDLAMPGMNGLELLRRVRERHPGLPAILVTGYAGDADTEDLAEASGTGPLILLRKPIDPDEVAAHAATLLNAPSSAS